MLFDAKHCAQVEGMAAMIRHCDALFGSKFGGDTDRTHQSQQTPKAKPQRSSECSWPSAAQPASLIAARQYPDGAENQPIHGSLNQQRPQGLNRQRSGNKQLLPLDVCSMSSHSSDSAKSMRLTQYSRRISGSAPGSPSKRQAQSFGRASKEQPWLPGGNPAQVDKALQKNKVR